MTAMATPEVRTPLSRLVKERRAELRMSLARVVEAAGDSKLNVAWVHRMERALIRDIPDVDRLEALARALNLPARMLKEAAGSQFLGIDTVYSESGEVRTLVYHWERLSPDDQERLMGILEAWSSRRDRKSDVS